jgi:hypothetical protein
MEGVSFAQEKESMRKRNLFGVYKTMRITCIKSKKAKRWAWLLRSL